MSSIQFPLQFEFQANKGFNSYYPASNAEVVHKLQQLVMGMAERQLFIYGAAGYGKSHLLQASCQLAHQQGINPFYYSFQNNRLPPLTMFDELETIKLVCLDNVHEIIGLLDWEQELLNFFHQQLENSHSLILSTHCHPADLDIKIPDLKNRLNALPVLALKPLADEEKVAALIYKAAHIGITITPKVGHFLLAHYASDMPSIWILLNQLDKATLAAQRKLTIPFLKQILESE